MGNVLFDLSEKLLQLRNDKEAIERDLRGCKKEIETVTKQMVDMMVQEEVQSFNKDGYTFYLKSRLFASILDEEKEDVFNWFKSQEELAGMVKEQINANTLSAWVKERIEEDDLPEEIESKLNIYEKTDIGVRSKYK